MPGIVLSTLLSFSLAHSNSDVPLSAACPLDAQNRIEPAFAWDVSTAQRAIATCPAHPISVVRRAWSGRWKKKCSGKATPVPPDDDPTCALPMLPLRTIVIHQTEASQAYGPDRLQTAHLDRGYDDIGYHYVIARTRNGWKIFEGRREDAIS